MIGQLRKKVRPVTSNLGRPPRDGLELPHIHVRPQNFYEKGRASLIPHPISTRLLRRYKSKQWRGSSSDNKKRSQPRTMLDADLINANINKTMNEIKMFKRSKNPTFSIVKLAKAKLEQKDKVPEPCKSCGRDDLPERLHTHRANEDGKENETKETHSKIDSEEVQNMEDQSRMYESRPWVSPSSKLKRNRRSMSFDMQLKPLLSSNKPTKSSPKHDKDRPASTATIKVIEISDGNESVDNKSVVDVIVPVKNGEEAIRGARVQVSIEAEKVHCTE